MKSFYLPFLLIVLLVSCKSKEPDNVTVIEEEPLRYLALGDSYTIGESVEIPQRWPMQLAEKLRQDGFDIEEPRIIATTGWTTGDLLQAMDMQLNNEKFDLVSVLIGVNNQYQGKSMEAYEEDLYRIFKQALSHSENGADGVFAVSIPDYGVTPFGAEREKEIGEELDQFNEIFKKVALEHGVDFYNITPISRRAKEEPQLIAADSLHPGAKMYREWVELIYPEVKEKIAAKN